MAPCQGDERCLCAAWGAAKAAAMPDWSFVALEREQRGLRSVWIARVESNVRPGDRRTAEADHPAIALRALASDLAGGRAP